jgi:mannose-6-phosphate isomerase-like protein (cupin superfamily)
MARLIPTPTLFESVNRPPELIEEFVGRVATGTRAVSIARIVCPAGWSEPGQTPEFDEYTLVLRGTLHVEMRDGTLRVAAGQAVITHKGEWVRYSTPEEGGAEYIAVCLPAFSLPLAHRES